MLSKVRITTFNMLFSFHQYLKDRFSFTFNLSEREVRGDMEWSAVPPFLALAFCIMDQDSVVLEEVDVNKHVEL